MLRHSTTCFVSFVFSLAVVSAARLVVGAEADIWPQWRGPTGDGIAAVSNPPTNWDAKTNVLWRAPLPGPAGATPVVWKDRIFLTSVDGDDLVLLCFDTSGKELWKRIVSSGNEQVRGDEANFASPSPSTDGRYVWTMMANGALACYDVSGKKIWNLDLQERYGKFDIQFGMSSTPVLDGDRLYVQLIHGPMNDEPHQGWVIALDKKTGREVWKHARITDAVIECKHSYASPSIYRDKQRAFLITHGGDYTIAHDLEDGTELWRCGGLNPKERYVRTFRFVASPVVSPGLIVVPTAKRGKVVGIRPDGKGDITDSKEQIAWTLPKNTPDVPSPLVYDGIVYLCRENGNLMALDAKTGELLYEQRTTRDRHRASPVCAAGKIYLTARNGKVTVVEAGRDFKVLAENDLGEPTTASPVLVGGRIYLRTFQALYAIGPR